MSKQTKAKPQVQQWTMQEIYDLLMFDIEPELLSDMIGKLPEIYAGESGERHAERMERYREAFAVFYQRFDMMLTLWKVDLDVFKKEIMNKFKTEALSDEGREISKIQQDIQNT